LHDVSFRVVAGNVRRYDSDVRPAGISTGRLNIAPIRKYSSGPPLSFVLCSPAVDDSVSSRHTTVAGAVGLFGLFAGLCAIFALVVTVFEWRAERAQAEWPVVPARIERAELEPHATSKGATTWSLRYRVRYAADWQERTASLSSRSTSSPADLPAMRAWLEQHRRGDRVDVRYDPAQPDHAVFAAPDVPNVGPRTPNNLKLTVIAAIACVVLIALARFLAAREPPDAATRPLSPRAKVYVGTACAAMGLLTLALGTHSALGALHATADDFMYVPAALAFVFAGVLLALPPERKAVTRLFGALLITSFAVTFDWIAFAPGERHFSGGISFGGFGIGARPGELFGRAMFGVGAVIADLVAVVLWLRLLRAEPA
jgi:hypothetical protein